MRNLCISHVKDVDGLASAAMVVAAKGGGFRLTDYDDLFEELDSVKGVDELTLCDLGTDASRFEQFMERLEGLSGRCRLTYIDHHFLTPESRRSLAKLPITLVHDPEECAGMLVYKTFKESLPAGARALALMAAVTDYMDGSPLARPMMERFDRQFILLESTLLSYALANHGSDRGYVDGLVRQLSKMRLPHAIRGVGRSAERQAEVVARLAREVGRRGVRLSHLAYMETKESSTGNVAKLLLGAFDVTVGASFKMKREAGRVEMSLRCTSDCTLHLGQAIGEIAAGHGGSGGGHKMAAGCSVPGGQAVEVLRELDARL